MAEDKVEAAVRTTNSFIYGTSTLLGEESSLDYLIAVREYVQDRIRKEADSWRPLPAKEINEYTETVKRRTERILRDVCRKDVIQLR